MPRVCRLRVSASDDMLLVVVARPVLRSTLRYSGIRAHARFFKYDIVLTVLFADCSASKFAASRAEVDEYPPSYNAAGTAHQTACHSWGPEAPPTNTEAKPTRISVSAHSSGGLTIQNNDATAFGKTHDTVQQDWARTDSWTVEAMGSISSLLGYVDEGIRLILLEDPPGTVASRVEEAPAVKCCDRVLY